MRWLPAHAEPTANLAEGRAARLREPLNTFGIRAESTSNADLDDLVETVRECASRIDTRFPNPGGGMAPPGQITGAHHADTFDRNVKGLLFTVQKAQPLLAEGACVILPGSTTAVMGTPALSVYSASKAAVRALARSWILALEDRPIRANVISRGAVRTPGPVELADDDPAARQGLLDHLASHVPPGRISEPREIAKMVLFLASNDSSFVNGVELFADGGKAHV